MRRGRIRGWVGGFAAVGLLSLPGVAAASSHQARVAAAPESVRSRAVAMPFTGVDLGLIAAGGGCLLLVGGGARLLGNRE
ncbi:MAG: hypothetical protein ACYDCH_15530 [Gaiellaceae bacterium]